MISVGFLKGVMQQTLLMMHACRVLTAASGEMNAQGPSGVHGVIVQDREAIITV